jgi:N-acetylglutamate synthase-like GNAT family acetyltransferase
MFYLRYAEKEDLHWINTCNIGVSGENIDDITGYYILQSIESGERIGMLALEMYEEVAYLHSLRFVGVAPTLEQLGKLFDHLIAYCERQGKQQLCMVVPPTSEWLFAFGFQPLDHIPVTVAASLHYQRVAPAGRLVGIGS